MIPVIALIVIILYLSIACILFTVMVAAKPDAVTTFEASKAPSISILVAARNESKNIASCLQSLLHLNYPLHKIEILVGDDDSEDETAAIIDAIAAKHQQVKRVPIQASTSHVKGKANVLMQLAQEANGTFLLITDADILVSPEWVNELLAHVTSDQVGIVSGTTLVYDASISGQLQGIDWLYFMGLLKSFELIGIPGTAVGNNMIIRKKAYESTGGYAEIPFSVTEDFSLYKAVRRNGWLTRNILTPKSLNISAPVYPFSALLHQRKRWLIGARQLPLYWWLLFGLLASVMPALIVLAFYYPAWALQLWLIKFALQSLFILVVQHRIGLRKQIGKLLLYEGYGWFVSLCTQAFFLLPVGMEWKKRKYN